MSSRLDSLLSGNRDYDHELMEFLGLSQQQRGPRVTAGIVAAVAEETKAILTRMNILAEGVFGGFSFWNGDLGGCDVVLVQCGPGRYKAQQAAMLLTKSLTLDVLLSVGLCGGLSKDLRIADVVVAQRFVNGGMYEAPERVLRAAQETNEYFMGSTGTLWDDAVKPARAKFRCWLGDYITTDRALVTSEQKQESAAASGADAVDMESEAVAAVAVEKGVRWAVVRAVSDTWNQDMPLDFNKFTNTQGEIDRVRIFMQGLKAPWLYWHLMRLKWASDKAAAHVAEYLEHFLPVLQDRNVSKPSSTSKSEPTSNSQDAASAPAI